MWGTWRNYAAQVYSCFVRLKLDIILAICFQTCLYQDNEI